MERCALIVNPSKAGAEPLTADFRSRCEAEGYEPLVLETTVEDPGGGMAREALERGAGLVVVGGGDGTVRAAAGELAGSGVPLAVVPLGTGNLLCRNLGIPVDDPGTALDAAFGTATRDVDVAWARVDDGDELAFAVMAGMGLDATIMANTNDDLKAKAGWFAYIVAAAQTIVGDSYLIKVYVDGKLKLQRRQRGVMIGNCGKIQGDVEVFPGATVDDGILDVLAVAPSGVVGWFRVASSLLSRWRRHTPPDLGHYTGKAIHVAASRPHDIQIDGDHLGTGRTLAVRVDPRALTVRIPA